MSLADLLQTVRLRRLKGRNLTAYEDVIARLYQAEVAKQALKAGDRMPGFLLPNAEGRLVGSDDLLAAGPLVASFFRGGWCPYCDVTMRAMEKALPQIVASGASFVAIWPETGGLALRTKRDRGLTYELLVDVDNVVAMQFGIIFRVPELYRQQLVDNGVNLVARHGNAGWLLPMPATYVIAPDGLIVYAFVDGDFTRRAEPAAILKTLAAITPRR
jgi:peroxiredoxin